MLWFIPQLRLSHQRQSVQGLSLIAHCILLTGYLADLVYGLGRHMPLAYIGVTLLGLMSLAYQQHQIRRLGYLSTMQRSALWLPLAIAALLIGTLMHEHQLSNTNTLDLIGMTSVCAGFLYSLPQLKKNRQQQHNPDLSVGFIAIGIACCFLDTISAFCLNWDYPNKIGAPLALFFSLALLLDQLRTQTRWQQSKTAASS